MAPGEERRGRRGEERELGVSSTCSVSWRGEERRGEERRGEERELVYSEALLHSLILPNTFLETPEISTLKTNPMPER